MNDDQDGSNNETGRDGLNGRRLPDDGSMGWGAWLRVFLKTFCACALFGLLVFYPFGALWIRASGDNAVERAVAAQARGEAVLFGSGLSQDFVDYKLRLYAAVRPEIAAVGSSRVMQIRGDWFRASFVNMGGAAGNLSVLASTINAMLKIHKPKVVLIGLDFWWFTPEWEKNPAAVQEPTSGSYNYSPENLKKPWLWLLEGKISLEDFFRPLLGGFGRGFRTGRYGIMAQRYDEGFGPDGAWNYSGELTGLKPPFDYRFRDTLAQVAYGIKAFYHAADAGPAPSHLEAFADIVARLHARGVTTCVFIPPLAPEVFEAMQARRAMYAHLFKLREALAEYGIDAQDFADPAALGASHCEFVDGFHGGSVAYARILRDLAAANPSLAGFVNMKRLDEVIEDWRGHAAIGDASITTRPEIDFMGFGCGKKGAKKSARESGDETGAN